MFRAPNVPNDVIHFKRLACSIQKLWRRYFIITVLLVVTASHTCLTKTSKTAQFWHIHPLKVPCSCFFKSFKQSLSSSSTFLCCIVQPMTDDASPKRMRSSSLAKAISSSSMVGAIDGKLKFITVALLTTLKPYLRHNEGTCSCHTQGNTVIILWVIINYIQTVHHSWYLSLWQWPVKTWVRGTPPGGWLSCSCGRGLWSGDMMMSTEVLWEVCFGGSSVAKGKEETKALSEKKAFDPLT